MFFMKDEGMDRQSYLPPKEHDRFYISRLGEFLVGFTVPEASRILKITHRSIVARTERKTIEHFFVNDRIFITDKAVACFEQGRNQEKIIEVEVYSCRTKHHLLAPFSLYSIQAVDFMLHFHKSLVVTITTEKIQMRRAGYIPKEILLDVAGWHISAIPNNNGNFIMQAYTPTNDPRFLAPELTKEKFSELKKYFFEKKWDEVLQVLRG